MLRPAAALILLASALPAQPKIEFEHYQLPNGLQVILHPDHSAPYAHINLRFFVGSKHEPAGRSGFAHLFEHLMYENADLNKSFVMEAESIAATGVNAGTHPDYTDYFGTIPANRLERMLWLESNQWAGLPQRLTQERFDRERQIVLNERRERFDNQPYAIAILLFFRNAYPPNHPYAHDTIGTPADLMAASLDDVRDFYRTYYVPDNASLVVSGDFDRTQVKSWIARYFGWFAPGPGLVGPVASAAPMTAPKMVEVTAVVPYTKFFLVWAGPGVTDPDAAALEIAKFTLDERWHDQEFRDRIQFDPAADYTQLEDGSIFVAETAVTDKITLDTVRSTIASQIERFAREGPTAGELERARSNLEYDQLSSIEDLHGVSAALNEAQQYYGGAEHIGDWAARYQKVTAEGARKAVNRWLLTANSLTIKFTPLKAAHGDTPEPDRKTPPPFQPEKPVQFPEIKSAKLSNGLQIFVVERRQTPKVSVELRLNLGPEYIPASKPALPIVSFLTTGCATPSRSETEIKTQIEDLAARLSAHSDAGSHYVTFEVLRKNFDAMFALFSDMLLHPLYPKEVFERRKSDTIEDWQRHEGRIDEFGSAVSAIAFGPTHPLGLSSSRPEALRDITVADVEDFKQRFWHPDIAVLVFAGDITLDEAVAAATKYFGEWSGTAEPPGKLPPPDPMKGRTFLLERKGVTQTSVVMILPGAAAESPDFPALQLADNVLGNGFHARLYQALRLNLGITYSVGSALPSFPGGGLWTANSPVQADKTREAMAAFQQVVRGMAGEKPITQMELDEAKQRMIGWWPEQFQSNGSIVAAIADGWVEDKSLTALKTFPQRIAAVTLEQVNAAARKYAQPDKIVFLLVGDPEKIGPIGPMVALKP